MRRFTSVYLLFLPSSRTLLRLSVAWLVAAGACLWYFHPMFACSEKALSCEEVGALTVASAAYGLAFAAFYTSLAVALDFAVKQVKSEAPLLEPVTKVAPVIATLFALQVVVLGCIATSGGLPSKWPWWLGVLGALAA